MPSIPTDAQSILSAHSATSSLKSHNGRSPSIGSKGWTSALLLKSSVARSMKSLNFETKSLRSILSSKAASIRKSNFITCTNVVDPVANQLSVAQARALLKGHYLFCNLTIPILNDIVKQSRIQVYNHHEIILRSRTPSTQLFFIARGRVSIFIEGSDCEIARFGDGAWFTELAPFQFPPSEMNSLTYRTRGETMCMVVSSRIVEQCCSEDRFIYRWMMDENDRRYRMYQEQARLEQKRHLQTVSDHMVAELWSNMERIEVVRGQIVCQTACETQWKYYLKEGVVQVVVGKLTLSFIHPGGLIDELNMMLELYPQSTCRCYSMTAVIYRIESSNWSAFVGKKQHAEYAALRNFFESKELKKQDLYVEDMHSVALFESILEHLNELSDKTFVTEDTRDVLASYGILRKTFAKDYVLTKNESGSPVYFVLCGKLQVLNSNTETIEEIGPGGVCGVIAALLDVPQPVSVVTLSQSCTLLELSSIGLHALSLHNVSAYQQLLKIAKERIYNYRIRDPFRQNSHELQLEIVEMLKQWDIASDLDPLFIDKFAVSCQAIRAPGDICISKIGSPESYSTPKIYVIISGKVALIDLSRDPRSPNIRRIFSEQDSFGYVPELKTASWNRKVKLDYVSMERTQILVLPEMALKILSASRPAVYENLLSQLLFTKYEPYLRGGWLKSVYEPFVPFDARRSLQRHIDSWEPDELSHILKILPLHDQLQARLVCRKWELSLRGKLFITTIKLKSFDLFQAAFLIQNSRKTLQNLHLNGPRINISFIRQLVEECPNIRSLVLDKCFTLRSNSIQLLAARLPLLEDLVLPDLNEKDGFRSMTWRNLKRLKFQRWNSRPKILAEILRSNPDLMELQLVNANHVGNDFFLAICSNCQFLTHLILPQARFISDACLHFVATQLLNLTHLNIALSPHVSDLGIQELSTGIHAYIELDISQCVHITDMSLVFFSKRHFHRLRKLNVRYCPGITNASIEYVTSISPQIECIESFGCPSITTTAETQEAGLVPLINSRESRTLAKEEPIEERYLLSSTKYARKLGGFSDDE